MDPRQTRRAEGSAAHSQRFGKDGEFVLDLDSHELTWRGRRLALRQQPARLLSLLLERAGTVVTREDIRRHLWGAGHHVDANQGINNAIRELRMVLGDNAQEPLFVQTVARVGYRFISPITPSRTHDAAPSRRWLPNQPVAALIATLGLATLVLLAINLRQQGSAATLPTDGSVREAFLKGRYLLQRGTREDAIRSLEHFELVVDQEPSFAPAHAALAEAYIATRNGVPNARRLARRAVREALARDDSLSIAHALDAELMLFGDWDLDGARTAFEHAIDLDPSLVRAWLGLALISSLEARHDDALAELAQARQIDPVSPLLRGELGWFLFRARQFERAASRSRETLELDPTNLHASLCLLESSLRLGHLEQAAAEALRSMRLEGAASPFLERLADAEAATIVDEFRRWRLKRFSQDGEPPSSQLAIANAALGDAEAVHAALESAYRERSAFLLYVRVDPRFDAFASDARFQNLMRQVGERVSHS